MFPNDNHEPPMRFSSFPSPLSLSKTNRFSIWVCVLGVYAFRKSPIRLLSLLFLARGVKPQIQKSSSLASTPLYDHKMKPVEILSPSESLVVVFFGGGVGFVKTGRKPEGSQQNTKRVSWFWPFLAKPAGRLSTLDRKEN